MCGIAGAFRHGLSRDNALETAKKMSDTLAHRGPDGQGSFVDNHILLGHRRLAIIDVEGSAQPLSNPTRGTHLAFNGEIYNYRELRKRLEAQGASFHTQGDTEVVLVERGLHVAQLEPEEAQVLVEVAHAARHVVAAEGDEYLKL